MDFGLRRVRCGVEPRVGQAHGRFHTPGAFGRKQGQGGAAFVRPSQVQKSHAPYLCRVVEMPGIRHGAVWELVWPDVLNRIRPSKYGAPGPDTAAR